MRGNSGLIIAVVIIASILAAIGYYFFSQSNILVTEPKILSVSLTPASPQIGDNVTVLANVQKNSNDTVLIEYTILVPDGGSGSGAYMKKINDNEFSYSLGSLLDKNMVSFIVSIITPSKRIESQEYHYGNIRQDNVVKINSTNIPLNPTSADLVKFQATITSNLSITRGAYEYRVLPRYLEGTLFGSTTLQSLGSNEYQFQFSPTSSFNQSQTVIYWFAVLDSSGNWTISDTKSVTIS